MKSELLGVRGPSCAALRGAASHRMSAERWALLALAGELCSSLLELECNRHLGLENASRRTSSACLFPFEQARSDVVGCYCLLRGKRLSVLRGGITRRLAMCVFGCLFLYAHAFAGPVIRLPFAVVCRNLPFCVSVPRPFAVVGAISRFACFVLRPLAVLRPPFPVSPRSPSPVIRLPFVVYFC